MPNPAGLSTWRVATTYVVTSLLLAAAWHVRFRHGLWIVNALAAIVGISLARFTLGSDWRRTFGWSKQHAIIGVTLGLLLVGGTQLSARLLLPTMPAVLAETQRLYAFFDGPYGARHFAPLIALVVIAEELVYRGVVTAFCEQRMRPIGTILCSTVLYVLPLAASGSWLLLAIGIALGTCWTLSKVWSRSLLVSLLAHCMWSCATFVVFPVG